MEAFPERQPPKGRFNMFPSFRPDHKAIKISRAVQDDQKDALRFVWPLAKKHKLEQPAINDRLA